MSGAAQLFDKRSDLFKRHFEHGFSYVDYVKRGSDSHRQRWERLEGSIALAPEQRVLLAGFKRTMNILVLSGIWCGDCARQCPMFRAFECASNLMRFKYVEVGENPELADELRMQGGNRVPLVVTLSEDFWEVGRFGDRTLSVYRRKASQELGAACNLEVMLAEREALAVEIREWLEHFERHQLILQTSAFLRRRYND